MFSKILVPVDGSPFMSGLLDYSIEFAKKLGAELTFLYVVDIPSASAASEVTKQKDACRRIVDGCKAKADQMNVKASARVESGRPGETIVNVSESDKFDLIIIGSRGYSHLRYLIIGSVADQVVSHASCPILIKR